MPNSPENDHSLTENQDLQNDMPNMTDKTLADDEDNPRPPVDPKNKLYTVISLLIFAVLYTGWQLIKDNIALSYSLYKDSFTEKEYELILDSTGYEVLPNGISIKCARINKGFDGNRLYIDLICPSDYANSADEDEYDNIAAVLPFTSGDPEKDVRYMIFPYEDLRTDYVYADAYVDVISPQHMCIVYEYNGETIIQLRLTDYDPSVEKAFGDAVKTKYGS